MNITDIQVAKQNGDRDLVLTAQNGTRTERRAGVNNIEIEIVTANAQAQNGGPNDRDDYRVTYNEEGGLVRGVLVERIRLYSQNGNNYTFQKTE